MVIQRLQTLFLLIAVILMALFTFAAPVATIYDAPRMVFDFKVWGIVNCLIAVLLLLAIFMYKNLKRQITVTLVSMVLICASAATGIFCISGYAPEAKAQLQIGTVALLVAALVFALLAYTRMKKDLKLLQSYNRLR